MAPQIRQVTSKQLAAFNTTGHRTCKATFNDPTLPNSLIVIFVATVRSGSQDPQTKGPSGFELAVKDHEDEVELACWYEDGSPTLNSVTVTAERGRSMNLIAYEVTGVAQSSSLDKVNHRDNDDNRPTTGNVTTTQNDEIVLAAVVNRYASSSQSGFTGGFTRLTETTTPIFDTDDYRSRMTTHGGITTSTGTYGLTCRLSSSRDWVATVVAFKGGTTGPARFVSKNATGVVTNGRGNLTVFGPLRSTQAGAALTVGTPRARVAPFNYQYRLNGWNGLLIGSGTRYYVEGTEGLYGWQVRTSDDDLPRGDGALRGIDLESARQIIFKMNVGTGREEVERNMQTLFNSLVPQRDEDWQLIWRHPEQPLKMLRCRPIDLLRDRNATQLLISRQQFVLRAADPRHYAAISKTVDIPVTTDPTAPILTTIRNEGNSAAYPVLVFQGPTSGPPVTRIELVNLNGLYTFDVRAVLPTGAELTGDMEARVTGVTRSIITLDGQAKYGSWQLPREPFRFEPDPVLPNGDNVVYLKTEPPGAPIKCTATYRDTWSG